MEKRVKLSEHQTKMIRLMQEGYKLTSCGCVIGHSGWTSFVRLTQHNYPKSYDKVVSTNIATVQALIRKGMIENISHEPVDSLNEYVLTQKGKEWKEEK